MTPQRKTSLFPHRSPSARDTTQHPHQQRDFPERPMVPRCRTEMQKPLGSFCGTLSARSGCSDAYCSYVQPSIPREGRSEPPWDVPGTCALFLTFCWPPQQRLWDRVGLGAHHETILLAQPFPLTQFMPGIRISLGSSLTAANICRVGRMRAWRRLGKHCMASTSQIKAAACFPARSRAPLL